jgi:hypothetical protein
MIISFSEVGPQRRHLTHENYKTEFASGVATVAHFLCIGNATGNEGGNRGKKCGFIGKFEDFADLGTQRRSAMALPADGSTGRETISPQAPTECPDRAQAIIRGRPRKLSGDHPW